MKKILILGLSLALVLAGSACLAEGEEPAGIDMTKPLPLGDSLLVMVVGMAIVFLGLTILIFLIKGLIAATDGMSKKKNAGPQTAAAAPAAAVAAVSEADEAAADDGLIAAVTAALMCVMEENQGFVVRRIRRV